MAGEPSSKKLKFEADALVLPERTIKLLRKALLALEQVPYCFNLIKITESNADEDSPFSKTYIRMERSSDKNKADRRTVYDFACIFMKGVEVLTSYLNDPKKIPAKKEIRIALERLVQTALRIEGIENLFFYYRHMYTVLLFTLIKDTLSRGRHTLIILPFIYCDTILDRNDPLPRAIRQTSGSFKIRIN